MLDSPLVQPLSRSSLVFLLVLDPQLHTPYISSPNHHLLFAAHAHTNAARSAAIPMLCHLYVVSLSLNSLLGSLSTCKEENIRRKLKISGNQSQSAKLSCIARLCTDGNPRISDAAAARTSARHLGILSTSHHSASEIWNLPLRTV